MFGDPHIETLDGLKYTFNGHGEYWMVQEKSSDTSFNLQARTTPAYNSNGPLINATVFSAFAGQDSSNKTFRAVINHDKTGETKLLLYTESYPPSYGGVWNHILCAGFQSSI